MVIARPRATVKTTARPRSIGRATSRTRAMLAGNSVTGVPR